MDLSGNTVLITGGGSGIGFALARRFVQSGSTVTICGRREDVLKNAQAHCPQLHYRVCDVSRATERMALLRWATDTFPALNVLVNNAGIQRFLKLWEEPSWEVMDQEISINLGAPVHLSTLFIPLLLKQTKPAIINITSGLSFVPKADVPVYCATKAALHSFTLSLRYQLSGTPVTVIEIIPPAVDTDLGGKGLHTFGVPVDEFADAVIAQLKHGSIQVTYGFSEKTSSASPDQLDAIFNQLNQA